MAKEINIIFLPDGTSNVDAIGFKGKECDKLPKAIEEALGEVTERQNKPEYGIVGSIRQVQSNQQKA